MTTEHEPTPAPDNDQEQSMDVNEKFQRDLLAYIRKLGLIESPAMAEARLGVDRAILDEEVDQQVKLYRDAAAKVEPAEKTPKAGARQQIAVYLMMALMYYKQDMIQDGDALFRDADDYAYQMNIDFPDFD